jgi:hypothetical protein
MRYHKGKLAWELLGWCVITNEDAAMSEEILGPWGIGTVRWLDGAA